MCNTTTATTTTAETFPVILLNDQGEEVRRASLQLVPHQGTLADLLHEARRAGLGTNFEISRSALKTVVPLRSLQVRSESGNLTWALKDHDVVVVAKRGAGWDLEMIVPNNPTPSFTSLLLSGYHQNCGIEVITKPGIQCFDVAFGGRTMKFLAPSTPQTEQSISLVNGNLPSTYQMLESQFPSIGELKQKVSEMFNQIIA